MGISRFPHGVFATPNLGGGRLIDMWNSENIFFVDKLNGLAGNTGQSPDASVTLPSTAVGLAGRDGVIYIRPATSGSSVQNYYTDNITVPLAKTGISIIGAGADPSNPYLGVEIKGVSAITTPVIEVNGAGCVIEGIRFSGSNTNAASYIISNPYNGTTARGFGMVVRGCRFQSAPGHLIGSGAAIYMATAIMCKIDNCIFNDNLCSIAARATYAAINGLYITNSIFEGYPLTNRDVDVFITGGGNSKGVLIDNCRFNDGLPNHGVVSRFISIDAGVLAGMISNCSFASSNGTTDGLVGAAGSLVIAPVTVFSVNNMIEDLTEEGTGTMTRT